jgi:hypothetical protein
MGLRKTRVSAASLVTGTSGQSGGGVGQNRPNLTKKSETMISGPQRECIMQRYAAGQSIRKISREEDRARETVTKIVHGDDMRTFVSNLRERFYALGEHALAAVEYGLVKGKDAQLGYRLLMDIGAVPSPPERALIPANREVVKKASLNEWERALVGEEEGQKGQIMIGVARMMQERAKFYDLKLPTPQEMRHNKAVAALINEVTGGQSDKLSLSNPAEWNRLKVQIEELLQSLAKKNGDGNLNRAEERESKESMAQESV